jgi:hypothetical protein
MSLIILVPLPPGGGGGGHTKSMVIYRHVTMKAGLLGNEWDWNRGGGRYDNAMHFFISFSKAIVATSFYGLSTLLELGRNLIWPRYFCFPTYLRGNAEVI